ncbi:NAD(P)-binding protein, partial [Pluteus cervinus]
LLQVTGVSGFIGAHVALVFLEAGFRVRGLVTARGEKVQSLTETVKIPGLEFTKIDDIATGDFSEALKGVDILLHVASPMPGSTSGADTLTGAINGTLNVLKQANAAGVGKIVVTSSLAASVGPDLSKAFAGGVLSDSSWGKVSTEEAHEQAADPLASYMASKVLAERATWKFAREHPEVDIATILPSYVFGPFAKGFPLPSSATSLGINSIIYELMTGKVPAPTTPWSVDVRDVAKAHLKAALLPRVPARHDLEEKRFLVSAHVYTWADAISNLNKRRPEVKTGKLEDVAELQGKLATIDNSRAKNVLGFKEWIAPEKMVEDTIDSIMEAKKTWAA